LTDVLETIQRESGISFPFLGDWIINPPSSFTLFGRTIYFYGVIIALGFLLGILWIAKNSQKAGIKEDDIYDVIIWTIPFSIIGARLYFVLFSLDYYIANPSKIIAVWEGGLAIYGGIIAGILVILLVCRHKKMNVLNTLDLIMGGLLIGQILGRWGNFFNREAFGAQTEIFCRMGLTSPDGTTIYVHPTFLYESLWNLMLFIVISVMLRHGKRKYNGHLFLIYLFGYGVGRALIEGLRTDSLYIGHTNIRVSQLLSVILVIVAGTLLIVNAVLVKKGTLILTPAYRKKGGEEKEVPAAGETTEEDPAPEGTVEAGEVPEEASAKTEESPVEAEEPPAAGSVLEEPGKEEKDGGE
jgi:phosphatidylglycerol:prolipoprotein diacylglycerol transferase